MLVVGLTGGIATGKSTVTMLLKKKGYVVIDADAIAHQLQQPGSVALTLIKETFGSGYLLADGHLNRKLLASLIFNDEVAKTKLNDIMHPMILNEISQQLKKTCEETVFIDAPLLFETGLDELVQRTIVVSASADNQLGRLMARDKIDEVFALKKINAQLPLYIKEEKADYILCNNGELYKLEEQLNEVLTQIKGG